MLMWIIIFLMFIITAIAGVSYLVSTILKAEAKAEERRASKTDGKNASIIPNDGNGKYWWVALVVAGLVVVGLVVWWMWSSSEKLPLTPGVPSAPGTERSLSPTPGGVWEYFKDYWFWAITGLALLFFASNALPESLSKGAKGMVSIVAITFVGAMLVHGIWGESEKSPSQLTQPACAPISDTKVNRCVLSERPMIFTTEKLVYTDVLEFCIVRQTGGQFESKKTGPNTFAVRSIKGTLPIEYKALKGACPDKF